MSTVVGEVQSAGAPPSSVQRKVSDAAGVTLSEPVNAKLALVDSVGVIAEGLEVIVTVGAVVSGAAIVHVAVAAVDWLPAASTARTLNVCEPTARPL